MILICHCRFTRRKTQEPTTGFERSDRAEVLLLLKVSKQMEPLSNWRERKWDLLEGPKGRFGWGYHPYTFNNIPENDRKRISLAICAKFEDFTMYRLGVGGKMFITSCIPSDLYQSLLLMNWHLSISGTKFSRAYPTV